MEYTFSWGWFFFGFILLLAGGAFTIWHQKIADAIGGGLGSYERYQMWGLIACGVGVLVMLNIHSLILTAIFSQFFDGATGR
jgi:hypothetical protein